MRLQGLVCVLALAGNLGGCSSIGYYYQAVEGQMQIWKRSRAIAEVIEDEKTPAALRTRLQMVLRMRDFASADLALPDNGSYRSYADLGRPFVVWNVFAAPDLSLAPLEWCFFFAGCVTYRGYFNQARAEQFSEELRAKGLDVHVGGVPAYSTLGWFDDPVLNTVMPYPDAELARLIFHELAHQVAYVSDDTMFNESFATAVEREGIERWLASEGDAAMRAVFEQHEARKTAFIALMMETRGRLSAIYAGAASDVDKRREKAATFAALKLQFQTLKAAWGGYTGYDRFFAQELGNAHLVPIATYSELVDGFRRLLADSGGDFKRFYIAVREIGKLPVAQRRAELKAD